jgi:hypothetical protein
MVVITKNTPIVETNNPTEIKNATANNRSSGHVRNKIGLPNPDAKRIPSKKYNITAGRTQVITITFLKLEVCLPS